MTESNTDNRKDDTTGTSHEGEGHTTTPQVQTPDKPSQAEGERETIDASIEGKDSASGS